MYLNFSSPVKVKLSIDLYVKNEVERFAQHIGNAEVTPPSDNLLCVIVKE